MCESRLSVCISGRRSARKCNRDKGQNVFLCVCVWSMWRKKNQFEVSRLCSWLSGTSQLFYLLNYEGSLSVTHNVQTLLYSNDKKRITSFF